MVGKLEWEVIKKAHKCKCVICGITEKRAGELQKAHVKASSKGGTQVLPMCPTCHRKFDTDKLTATELRKIGLTKRTSARLSPKKRKRTDDWWF
ncbi:hypothetical protein ACFLUN_00725 [Chloroflexota bacterium]